MKGPQAGKPDDAHVLPNILGGSLSFLASKGAPLGKRLPHPTSPRPDVSTSENCGHWTPAGWPS